jgi:hypothetical protein
MAWVPTSTLNRVKGFQISVLWIVLCFQTCGFDKKWARSPKNPLGAFYLIIAKQCTTIQVSFVGQN